MKNIVCEMKCKKDLEFKQIIFNILKKWWKTEREHRKIADVRIVFIQIV
jgi:hypothetical protein